MSEAARSQFAWPAPGIPRLEGDAALDVADKSTIADDVRARSAQRLARSADQYVSGCMPATPMQSNPLAAFCLVVMSVDEARTARRWFCALSAAPADCRSRALQVDHLLLRGNRRYMHTRVDGEWSMAEVNP
jgi:hypothetical protein